MFKVLHESFLFPGTGDVKAERKVNGLCKGKSFPSSQALKPAVDDLKSPFTKKTGFLFCLDLRFLIMCLCTCWWGQRSIALLPQQLCILCAEAESQPGVHGFIRLAGQQAQGLLSPPSLMLVRWVFSISQATFQFFIILGIGCKTCLCGCRADVLLLSPELLSFCQFSADYWSVNLSVEIEHWWPWNHS